MSPHRCAHHHALHHCGDKSLLSEEKTSHRRLSSARKGLDGPDCLSSSPTDLPGCVSCSVPAAPLTGWTSPQEAVRCPEANSQLRMCSALARDRDPDSCGAKSTRALWMGVSSAEVCTGCSRSCVDLSCLSRFSVASRALIPLSRWSRSPAQSGRGSGAMLLMYGSQSV